MALLLPLIRPSATFSLREKDLREMDSTQKMF